MKTTCVVGTWPKFWSYHIEKIWVWLEDSKPIWLNSSIWIYILIIILDSSWVELSWAESSWVELSRAESSWVELSRVESSWVELSWAETSWVELSWAELSWVDKTIDISILVPGVERVGPFVISRLLVIDDQSLLI